MIAYYPCMARALGAEPWQRLVTLARVIHRFHPSTAKVLVELEEWRWVRETLASDNPSLTKFSIVGRCRY